jgi:hypothetical protein
VILHPTPHAPRLPDDARSAIASALYSAPIARLVENRIDLRSAIDAATDEAELHVIAILIELNQDAIKRWLYYAEPTGHA